MTPFELEAALKRLIPRHDREPRPKVWAAVVTRRASGERFLLTDGLSQRKTWRWTLLLAAAAVLVLTVTPASQTDRTDPSVVRIGPAISKPTIPFLPGELQAQGSSRPSFRSVAGSIGLRVQAGRWTYRSRQLDGRLGVEMVYHSIPVKLDGHPAWLLVWPQTDSLWATWDSLRPLRRVHRVAAGWLQQFYSPGQLLTGLTTNGYTSWEAEQADSTQSLDWAMVRWSEIVPILQGIPLRRGWTGSIPLTASAFGRTWFDLRVDGEEDVTVPMGRFHCWRLQLLLKPTHTFGTYYEDHPVPSITLWVSQDPQWLVQGRLTSDGYSRTVVLASVDPISAEDFHP